jgi:exodeoxyribonuclease VII large subunit
MNSGLFAAEEKESYSAPETVSQVTRIIKSLLEGNLGRVWVEGEISNFSAPRSGHYYFTLKDEHASIQCVMWRSSAAKAAFVPEDGIHVEVRGKVAVYEPQGRYQIVCDSIKSIREGTLQQKFEEMKAKLQEEGFFDLSHKKELPEFPKTVGIVTSGTGAVVRDIIRILKRRMPGINIIVSPCKVQGEGAKEDIVAALSNLDNSGMCDVIIVGRGGGSLEDLWAFNEEMVARAVFEAETPVVSAVGHETDFSITDLVADLRAATPSEAAEMVVGDIEGMREHFRESFKRLNNALSRNLEFYLMKLKNLYSRPVLCDPMTMVMLKEQHIDELSDQLIGGLEGCLNDYVSKLSLLATKLQALSPLNVMARGYSMTWLAEKRKLVRNVSEVTIDSLIETNLAEGMILSRVTEVFPGKDED